MTTEHNEKSIEDNSRRSLLLGAAAATTAFATSAIASMDEHEGHKDYSKHNHANHKNPNEKAIDASLHCVKQGNLCQDHCIDLIKGGDQTMIDCLNTVTEMLPMCETLSKLASLKSDLLPKFANVCIDACVACEKECRKHADMHVECKNCAESCAACIVECKKLIA